MVTLKGEHVFLRALEPEDLDFVYQIENDERCLLYTSPSPRD